jgi:hypothetical protein
VAALCRTSAVAEAPLRASLALASTRLARKGTGRALLARLPARLRNLPRRASVLWDSATVSLIVAPTASTTAAADLLHLCRFFCLYSTLKAPRSTRNASHRGCSRDLLGCCGWLIRCRLLRIVCLTTRHCDVNMHALLEAATAVALLVARFRHNESLFGAFQNALVVCWITAASLRLLFACSYPALSCACSEGVGGQRESVCDLVPAEVHACVQSQSDPGIWLHEMMQPLTTALAKS